MFLRKTNPILNALVFLRPISEDFAKRDIYVVFSCTSCVVVSFSVLYIGPRKFAASFLIYLS